MIRQLYDALRLNFWIFPGITRAESADFLAPYYTWLRSQQGPARTLLNALVWVGFQCYVPFRARTTARKWHRDAEWARRASRWGRKYFVDPGDIAAHQNDCEADFATYQRRFEQIMVIRGIESEATDHSPRMIDKGQFQSHCEAHHLPVPGAYARVIDGQVERLADWPIGAPVLLKPVRGSGGFGISIEHPESEAHYTSLLARLDQGEWLVQEAAKVHPDLADLALDALSTARIVTILNEREEPEIVSASIRFAVTPGIAVDNNHRGGLSALIDLETGALGKPMEIEGPRKYDRHPTTGAQVEERIVPDWEAAKTLAIDAHAKAFGEHVLIGWDIGLSDRGPLLIEANQRPNVRLTQRIEGKGIGEMRYGELIAFHLDRTMSRGPLRKRPFLTKS